MDHVVFVSRANKELDLILGGRTMIIRGSLGKKVPYGRVNTGDRLFFATGNGTNVVKATASVLNAIDTPKLAADEVTDLLSQHKGQLALTDAELDKWSKKKYMTLLEIEGVSPVVPFTINAYGSGEDDDWVVLDDIDEIIE